MATEHGEHTCGGPECIICHSKCEKVCEKKFECNHTNYHEKCINEWLKVGDSCPYCRAPKRIVNDYKIPSKINNILENSPHPKIYVMYPNQILPASLYKEAQQFDGEIKLADTNILNLYNNDILYHFS